MVNEEFLNRAVDIRKTYIKLTSNLDNYLEKVKTVTANLEKTVVNITEIEKKYKDKKENVTADETFKELLKVLERIETEGKKLEKFINPLNKEIEKLSKEEVELYRLIKEKHHNLTEDQIVNSVRSRLKLENLI